MSTLIYGLIPLGASSGAVAIDGAKGNAISLTLSGNVTLGATNLKVGTTYYALVTQASVGGPFQADASAFGGPADPISPSAGSVTLLAFLATSGSALKYIGATVENATTFGFEELGDVSGAVELDGATASAWRLTMIGNTSITFVNLVPGITYSIQVLQDAVGGRIVTFPGAYSDFDYVGQEAYSGPEFTTIYQLTAHTSSTGAISTYAGNAFVSVAYNFAGVDGDPNFGFHPGFSVPNDPLSRFEPCVFWQGPCTGAGPSVSGIWYFQSAAGVQDIAMQFVAAGAGPVAADLWAWTMGCGWSVSIPGAADAFTLAVGGATRIIADADGVTVRNSRARWTDIATTPVSAAIDLWYYATAGADVLNLPAGSAAIDGLAIGLTNFSGSDMTTNPDGTDEINGVAAAHTTPDGGTTWFTWHDSDNNWVALGS